MRTNEPLQQYIMMLHLRLMAARRNRNTLLVFFGLGLLGILADYWFIGSSVQLRFVYYLVEILLGFLVVYSSAYLRLVQGLMEFTEVLERQGITPPSKPRR